MTSERLAILSMYVCYKDQAAAIEWLCRAIGFEKVIEFPDEQGGIAHAELRLGDAVIMIQTDHEGLRRRACHQRRHRTRPDHHAGVGSGCRGYARDGGSGWWDITDRARGNGPGRSPLRDPRPGRVPVVVRHVPARNGELLGTQGGQAEERC